MTKDYCYGDKCLFTYCYEDFKSICKELSYVSEVGNLEYEEVFRPSPRSVISVNEETVELDYPPEKRVQEKQPLLVTIGPAFTMALPMVVGCVISVIAQRSSGTSMGPFMYTGMITALTSALVGVFWGSVNIRNREKNQRIEEAKRQKLYINYVRHSEEIIREKYLKQASDYRLMAPPVDDYLKGGINKYLLWGKKPDDEDFLFVRLGTGSRIFNINIAIPKDKFSVVNDELKQLPKRLKYKYRMLKDVPIGINLRNAKRVGVISEDIESRIKIISQILLSLCVSISPEYMRIIFDFSNETNNEYEEVIKAFKFMPHISTDNYYLEDDGNTGVFIVVADDFDKAREKHRAYEAVYIIIANAFEELKTNVNVIIHKSKNYNGIIEFGDCGAKRTDIYFDNKSLEDVAIYSRTLMGLMGNTEKRIGGFIPEKISFYELIGRIPDAEHIKSLWDKNRASEGILAPVGICEDKPLILNLHEKSMGPHGLLVGTTGSGKSEILQTIILSLALNYSPLDVGFFLIDYKGGGMASLFDGLPHLMGQISNLSGKMIQRAMLSIRSENERRQRLFLNASVNNISDYERKYYRNKHELCPLPHIFIIVDEFAELKKEQPEFMGELISVARVGRSLGVHLLLATQKPSGTVDDNIWSNSRFKICLKVQDKMDSTEVLHKPDAALLKNPGRAYLQVGNDEIYCQFQGAYTMDRGRNVGGEKKTEFIGRKGEVLNEIEKDTNEYSPQLVDCIEHIKEAYEHTGINVENRLWLPPLEKFYGFRKYEPDTENPIGTRGTEVTIGIYDNPKRQKIDYLKIDIINKGNHIIQGTFGSGKSTFLMTISRAIIESEIPDKCSIYFIDYSGGLFSPFMESLCVGGIIGEENEEDLEKLLYMIIRIIDERKKTLSGQVFRNIVGSDISLPAIYLFIDGIGIFRERTEGAHDKELLYILKNGPAAGIYTIATVNNTSSHEISGRMLENFTVNIPLNLPDKYAYKEALKYNGEGIILPDDVSGRGLYRLDNDVVEFQAFYPTDEAVIGYELSEKLYEFVRYRNSEISLKTNKKALRIPSIPKSLVLSKFIESIDENEVLVEKGLPVGYVIKTGEIYYLPKDIPGPVIVTGRLGSGKKNFKKVANYVNKICKQNCEIALHIYEESSNFDEISEIKKLAGINPYVIHFGGQLDRVTIADFSYIPYSQQVKIKGMGIATVRKIDEEHFYGDIVVPLCDTE